MTVVSENNERRFAKLKAWSQGRAGLAGKGRLIALGVAWPRWSRPDLAVEAMGQVESAPVLPPLETFRDKMSFTCGVLWGMALIDARARQMESNA